MRNIYVGESDHEARRQMTATMAGFYEEFATLWRRHGDSRYTGPQDFTSAIEQGLVIAGSAGTVRTQLAEIMRTAGANHFAGAFAFGSLSYEQAQASVGRFADEVAPTLRALASELAG